MDVTTAKQAIKDQGAAVFAQLVGGLTKAKHGGGKGQDNCCPFCKSGSGRNGTSAFTLRPDGVYRCNKCGESGDVFTLYAKQHNLTTGGADFAEIVKALAPMAGVSVDEGQAASRPQQRPSKPPEPERTAAEQFAATMAKGFLPERKPGDALTGAELRQIAAENDRRVGYVSKAIDRLHDTAGATADEGQDKTAYMRALDEARAYLLGRGFDAKDEALADFNVGLDPCYRHGSKNRVILPTLYGAALTGGLFDVVRCEARAVKAANDNDRWRSDSPKALFLNSDVARWRDADYIYVAEGSFDALALAAGLRTRDVIGLNSTQNAGQLLELVRVCRGLPPSEPLHITGRAVFVLLLDTDAAGRDANAKLQAGLSRLGLRSMDISGDFLTHGKDPAETLLYMAQGDPANAGHTIAGSWPLITKAMQDAIGRGRVVDAAPDEAEPPDEPDAGKRFNYAANLRDEYRREVSMSKQAYPTGIPQLDAYLDGGLYKGLYVLGAVTSVGKTTLALQICDFIAEHGQDVYVFSLEMSAVELIAKSVSRISYQLSQMDNRGLAWTTRQILNKYSATKDEARRQNLHMAEGAYFDERAGRIVIYEGKGDTTVDAVAQKVSEYIAATGRRPVVLVDYLQILAPGDAHKTDKQNIDRNIVELKRLARDKEIPVIAVSSFNRTNYDQSVNLTSFKESGAIEYGADTVLGLQMEYMKYAGQTKGGAWTQADRDERQRQLKAKACGGEMDMCIEVLKNRNGSSGTTTFVKFCAKYNHFRGGQARGNHNQNPDKDKPQTPEEKRHTDAIKGLLAANGSKPADEPPPPPPTDEEIDVPF